MAKKIWDTFKQGESSSISCWLFDTYFSEEMQDSWRAGYQNVSISIQISHSKVYQKLVIKK